MTIMVELIGGQPLPNFLPVRHYHPRGVLLVYTPATRLVHDRLQAAIKRETDVYSLQTDPYDIPTIVVNLNDRLDAPEFTDQSLIFNLTGGTKAMSLAAYQVAQQRNAPILYLESEGKRSRVYRYWEYQHRQAASPTSELIPECVTLDDMFNVHLGLAKWQRRPPNSTPGSRFEQALAATLQAQGYEVMTGVQAMDGQIDIDVALRCENQLGVIEAKTGPKGRELHGIKQLSTTIRHLGTFTKTFYVITVAPEPRHEVLTDAARINVVSLPSYVSGSDTLLPGDAARLIAAVDEAMKGHAP